MRRRRSRRDGLLTVTVPLVVPYHDADPAGVAWHGSYFRYFDVARCALLNQINYGYREMERSGYLWPIVDTRVRYIRPLYYDQRIQVCATLLEWEYRLRLEYEIRDDADIKTTEGYTIQAAVSTATRELVFGAPEVLLERLRQHSTRSVLARD